MVNYKWINLKCHENQLYILLSSKEYMIIILTLKINSVSIERVTEFNFLGVTVDVILNWDVHNPK